MHLNKLFLQLSQLKWNSLFPTAEKRLQIESQGIRRSRSLSYENAEVSSLETDGCSALGWEFGVYFHLDWCRDVSCAGTVRFTSGAAWGLLRGCGRGLSLPLSELPPAAAGGRSLLPGDRAPCRILVKNENTPQVIHFAHPNPR